MFEAIWSSWTVSRNNWIHVCSNFTILDNVQDPNYVWMNPYDDHGQCPESKVSVYWDDVWSHWKILDNVQNPKNYVWMDSDLKAFSDCVSGQCPGSKISVWVGVWNHLKIMDNVPNQNFLFWIEAWSHFTILDRSKLCLNGAIWRSSTISRIGSV